MNKPEWYDHAGKEPFKRNHFHRDLAAGVTSRIGTAKQATSRIRWYLGGAAAAVVVAVVAISSFLSNGGSGHTLSPSQTQAVQTEGPTPTNTQIPNPSVKLEAIPYTNDQFKQIAELAKNAGMDKVYLPKIAVQDCPLTSVEVQGNTLALHYKYMTIGESKQVWDELKDVQIKKVTLANGAAGEWINGKDNLPRDRSFRFQMNDMYFILDDARYLPEDLVQKIAESFVSLDILAPDLSVEATNPVVVGTSASCDTPPQQLEFGGKTYRLKSGEASGQPAMKLAYFKCDKGTFTLGDAEDAYSVSSAGDPAKNNGEIIVMGNWGGTGTWSQSSYSLVTPQTSSSSDSVYTNTQYGFQFSLPESWKGYSILNNHWEGFAMDGDRGEKVVETGPMISIRDPGWTAQTPKQDIPIMVFTISQWNSLQQGAFNIGAAPVGPSELGRNETYAFALPARYNDALLPGYEDVEKLLENKPLKALN